MQPNAPRTSITSAPAQNSRSLARIAGLLAVMSMTTFGVLPTVAVPPSNDDIANAVVVTEPLPFSDAVSTVEATPAPDDPNCAGNGPTVWYAFTPSVGGWIEANTFGSDYDTTLSAYTGAPGSLSQLACNDDSGSLQSRVIIEVTAGTTYYFMAGAFASGPGGSLVFSVAESAPPAVVDLTTAQLLVAPSAGTANVDVIVTSSSPVFIYEVRAVLVQPTGRGNIVANASAFVFEETDAYAATLSLKDSISFKARGTGFVGGKARLQTTLIYEDPIAGFQFLTSDEEVQLRGSNGK